MPPNVLDAPRLTVNEAAKRMGVHPSSVWRWILTGVRGRKLVAHHFGARRRILLSDLEAFLTPECSATSTTSVSSTANLNRATEAAAELNRRGV